MQLQDRLFEEIPAVRYVAIANGESVSLKQRDSIHGASSSESDRYEELFVNPALIQLTNSRGRIDCGGLEYLLVRYGNFFQYVQPTSRGHISVALEPDADLQQTIVLIQEILGDDFSKGQ